MSRKFIYNFHALIENYSTNNVTHLIYNGINWVISDNIVAGPSSNNLSSLAANMRGSRVLYANYTGGGIVPLDFNGTTWTPGTLVSQLGGNCAAVTMSDDGLHALSSGDFSTGVTPYEFNVNTGLWVAGTPIPLASQHFNSVQMSRDGSKALAVPKYDDIAFALTRDPGTGLWSQLGGAIPIVTANERFFSIGFSPDGNAAIIGAGDNVSPTGNANGLTWNGSGWDVSLVAPVRSAYWHPNGHTILCAPGTGAPDLKRIICINYDPITKTFSDGQVLADGSWNTIASTSISNDAIGNVALASNFFGNNIIPLTYSSVTGLFTAGPPIISGLFSNPWNMLVFAVF